jgi:hypothetical protein
MEVDHERAQYFMPNENMNTHLQLRAERDDLVVKANRLEGELVVLQDELAKVWGWLKYPYMLNVRKTVTINRSLLSECTCVNAVARGGPNADGAAGDACHTAGRYNGRKRERLGGFGEYHDGHGATSR